MTRHTQVFGNHTTVTVAGAWGQFELNVFKPVLIASLLQSIRHRHVAPPIVSCTNHAIQGMAC